MLTSYYTCNLLVQCSHLAGKPTYEEIGTVAYGKHMGNFVAANMIVNNYGTLVAYMVLVQELPPGALKLMGVENKVALSGLLWGGGITVFVVLPLSLARKVSVLSFCSSLFITCVIVSQAFALPNTSFSSHVSHASLAKVPSTQPDIFSITLAIPLVVFAYTCQQNIPYIYKVTGMQELRERTLKRGQAFLLTALSLAMSLYLLTGIFGYLTFDERYSTFHFPSQILSAHYGHGNGLIITVRAK
jgi:amino acid permease